MKLKSWGNIKLICGNHGSDYTQEMELMQGPHSLFYKCPCYKSIYGSHDALADGERSCNNRLDLIKYEKLLDRIDNETQSNPIETMNIQGLSFKQDGVEYTVLEQNDEQFKVLMLNRKAMTR